MAREERYSKVFQDGRAKHVIEADVTVVKPCTDNLIATGYIMPQVRLA